ncbi:glycoside hydrolase family 6 protein [Streptomyces sp. NPDC001046]|uniref:glycoside hydrolase family 6 protein n=1 Tax=Streptomyces sp. NPDC001046 TaxID=3364543 RepID=UPI0036A0D653
MGTHHRRRSKWIATGLAATGLLGGLGIAVQTTRAADADESRTSSSATFYVNPASQVVRWVTEHAGDPRAMTIGPKIADVPTATWFVRYTADPAAVTASVKKVTDGAAAENQTAVVVPYMIPNRDCGSHSAGGAPDFAAYSTWMEAFAKGLGNREVYVLLEPDSLAQAASCNSVDKDRRIAALSEAGATIKEANPAARVYYDAGHSGWKVSARDLRDAGVLTHGDGVVSNVSNYRATKDEVAYGKELLGALGDPPGLGIVVDTSRNGNGPAPDAQWCDPPGRAIGSMPTTATGDASVDAFLWVKVPGESDGCIAGAGQFVPDRAVELARAAGGSEDPGNSASDAETRTSGAPADTEPRTDVTPPASSPPPRTDPSPEPTACSATFEVAETWKGGYRAGYTLKNGAADLDSWKVEWALPDGQRLVNAWNVVAEQDGVNVRGTNAPYNGAVKAGGTVSLGFVAEGEAGGAAPVITLNGADCITRKQ